KDIRDELRYNQGRVEVLDPRTGDVKTDMENRPVTLKSYLADYAKRNPWMVESQVDGGSGSEPARKTDKTVAKKSVRELTSDEFEAIEQKVLAGQKVDLG